MSSATNTLRTDFVVESREHLQVLENSMLSIENAVGDSEVREFIDVSLRAVHSLKGNAGFMGFHKLQNLAHATESVLENYRDSSVAPPRSVVESILATNDRLAAMLDDLDHSESQDISSLLQRLNRVIAGSSYESTVEVTNKKTTTIQVNLPAAPNGILAYLDSLVSIATLRSIDWPESDLTKRADSFEVSKVEVEIKPNSTIFDLFRALSPHSSALNWSDIGAVDLRKFETKAGSGFMTHFIAEVAQRSGELFYEPADLTGGLPKAVIWVANDDSITKMDYAPIDLSMPALPMPALSMPALSMPALSTALPTEPKSSLSQAERITNPAVETVSSNVETNENREFANVKQVSPASVPNLGTERSVSLRIQVELLDRLMNLVGELTLVRNQALLAFGELDGTPRAVIQRLNSVTSELQVSVLKTRMQPVGSLFDRFPRMVRDLSRQLGKEIELVTVGQEVELDKTVLEQLSDPLIHLIRNSIDHGLETPRVRLHAGKPRIGKVTLSAKTADGQVVIEVRDDGRGIDPNAVRTKVLALGLKTESELQKISPKELYSYILLPGFSTAKQVSDVSGRGVGMDVVRTNIERLEGSLTIDSKPGKGTSMVMRVPLTLAIIPCLIVTVGEERFAVPQRGLE